MKSEVVRIGYESRNYGAAKNTYAPVAGVEHRKIRRIPLEFGPGRLARDGRYVFVPLRTGQSQHIDLVHLWNRISAGRLPWGVSFEFDLPVAGKHMSRRIVDLQRGRLLDPHCRFIIAISDHARQRFVRSLTASQRTAIEPKLHTILPDHALAPRVHPYVVPEDHTPLRLIFVGVTFFGKGGEAVLNAFEDVATELNLELTVVSPVAGNDYGNTPPSDVDLDQIRRRLSDNPRINWLERCTNEAVLEMIQSHHVGLLPTFADTFGYAALEFMAMGAPSIVSNVQALPEFTGVDTGWQVSVSVDDEGIWLGRHPDHARRRDWYHATVDDVSSQLAAQLLSIRNAPRTLESISISARQRYSRQFDSQARANRLRSVYLDAVAD